MKTQKIIELTRVLRSLYSCRFRKNYNDNYFKECPQGAYYVGLENEDFVITKDHVHNLEEELHNAVLPVILKYIELIESELKSIVNRED